MEQLRTLLRVRRGRRIAHRLSVILHWREPQGQWQEVLAETRILSEHGCLLCCPARVKLSDRVMVCWQERMRYAQARVVFRAISPGSKAVEVALEFLDNDNFWRMDFHGGLSVLDE